MAITHVTQYLNFSFEELHVQDYGAGRKKGQLGMAGGFGAPAAGTCVCFCVSLWAICDTFSMLTCLCVLLFAHTCKHTHVHARTPLTAR